MKVLCRFKGWLHGIDAWTRTIKTMQTTSIRTRSDIARIPLHSTMREMLTYIFQMDGSPVDSKVDCNHKCKKCEIHLSIWMEVLCRDKGWLHSQTQEMLNTSIDLDGCPCRFKDWPHSKMQDPLYTSCNLDGSHMSRQRLTAIERQDMLNTSLNVDGSRMSIQRLQSMPGHEKWRDCKGHPSETRTRLDLARNQTNWCHFSAHPIDAICSRVRIAPPPTQLPLATICATTVTRAQT
jgi:hypothetical protein